MVYLKHGRGEQHANNVSFSEKKTHQSARHAVLRATWYYGTAQPLSMTEFKWHLFELYFIG